MNGMEDFQADRARYPKNAFLREQSLWAIWVYRFGRATRELHSPILHWLAEKSYWALFRIVETLTGCSFPKSVEIGPGLRIHHFGNIFIHRDAKIGSDCTLRQGVTIGTRFDGGPVPVIGNGVDIGAGAQVLGGVHVGNGAKIGALSLVLEDVPNGATAVGIPARIIPSSTDHR